MRYTLRSSSGSPTLQRNPPSKAKKRRAAVKDRKDLVSKEIALFEDRPSDEPKPASDLKTIVQYQTSQDQSWKEVTKAVNASKSGASFFLKHPCEVGRLVTLVISMPVRLRVYDLNEEFYPVVGLIQYCHETQTSNGKTMYAVGVAFVGKEFPPGYAQQPTQNYHISGTTPLGMWQIRPSTGSFTVRGATRFWVTLDVTITLIQRKNSSDYKQETVTCNVSTSGALVVCTLEVSIGQKVKLASKEKEFYSICVVRDIQRRRGRLPLLHLEFVDNKFPIEKIPAPIVTAVTV